MAAGKGNVEEERRKGRKKGMRGGKRKKDEESREEKKREWIWIGWDVGRDWEQQKEGKLKSGYIM